MAGRIKIDNREINTQFRGVSTIDQFKDKISYFMDKYSDNEYLEFIKSNVPGSARYYGVPVPVLRVLSKKTGEFCRNNKDLDEILLRKLWEKNSREERKIVAEAIAHIFDYDDSTALTLLIEFIPDLNNWELCDTLACTGLKSYALDHPDMVFRMINSWIKSPNPWIRRFGVISLIPISHNKKTEDLDLFLVILKKLMKDENEMVQKAVAWVLREISYKDPHRVGKFLEVFAKSPETAARKIILEGSKKLDPKVRESLFVMLH